jgi:sugar phosphate isomerase/epimerase
VGPNVDATALKEYVTRNLDRCRELGSGIVVWGSAGSRNVPEGFSRAEAWNQIKSFLHEAGDMARSRKVIIAIEPLTKSESNIINTGDEAFQLVREVGHPNVKMIVDYYHMRLENESPDILRKAADEIVHLHFANPKGRRWPKLSDDDPEYARFFEILKEIRYRGGISIEGRGTIEADAAGSLAFFRQELQV